MTPKEHIADDSLRDRLVETWDTNSRITEFFIRNLPSGLWDMKLPGAPRRSIRMVAGHVHNARCTWIKMVGRRYHISPPRSVDRRHVSQATLLRALRVSSGRMIRLLEAGLEQGGRLEIRIPWSNIPSDVVHFMTYIVAHEAHHRGQIILAARMMGHRLPPAVTNGVWQWKQHAKAGRSRRK